MLAEDFKQLFNQYYPALCAFALKYLHNKQEAEDVVCGLFVHLWEQRAILQIYGKMDSYLISAVHNRCLNVLRTQASKRAQHEQYRLSIESVGDYAFASEAEQHFDQENLQHLLAAFIRSLPRKCAEIFVLNREQNLSYQEIADHLHINIGTVKTQMFRATKKLQKAFKAYTFSLFL